MDIIALSLDNLFSHHADDKEGEKDLAVAATAVPTTLAEADAQRAEASEAEVVDDAIISHEAEAEVVDDVVRVDVGAHDKDLSIIPAADAGDEKDEGEDDDDDEDDDDGSPSLPDAGKDLGGGDDEEDDHDNFTIQYHKPASTLKGVSLKDSSS
ncbi:pheromone-processing carboxypeptidase KEX1-like [Cynara cardunculus var. scolymus]|uniref:pheromone-processing carboxypeptidase KEX1-like n=1 Tax=Cynara cardunculus var. scolymus TaxID=59895 RepID=UPI000D6263F9|nr:pheromone-processing carboxypeptidase KEX1-like [Cynara cardunculus var. scolymus]